MKNKAILLLLSLFLTSCTNPSTSNKPTIDNKESAVSEKSDADSKSNFESASKNNSVSSSTSEDIYDTFYLVNDIHGSIEENTDVSSPEAGFAKLDYFIRTDEDYSSSSFLICGGDTYQGSYQAYHSMDLVNELLSDMNVIASAVGNHEFDWSSTKLKELVNASPFPIMACNILSKSTGKQVDFVKKSTIYTSESSAKFGIIGIIGPGEESDIMPSYIQDYTFSSEAKYVKEELDKMKDCDYHILLCHDSPSNNNGYLNRLVPELISSNYQIDAVCGAHTHMFESSSISGVPYVQAGSNTRGYGKFKFRRKTKKCVFSGYNQFTKSQIKQVNETLLDPELVSKIQGDRYYTLGKESLNVSLNGTLEKTNHMHKFLPTVILEQALRSNKKKTNPIIAVHNGNGGIRSSIPQGMLTRNALFKASPFMNKLRIRRNVSGNVVNNTLGISYYNGNQTNTTRNYLYRIEDDQPFSTSQNYDVVTIDFVYESSFFKKMQGNWEPLLENGEDIIMPEAMINYVTNYPSSVIDCTQFDCTK